MALDSKHPQYAIFLPDWVIMRDTNAGERVIKEALETYLPATSGQTSDGIKTGQPGRDAYNAYVTRASFPDIVRGSVESMIGVMHHKPPVIELPEAMEPMREMATLKGESLELLLRRINENQLIFGRLGLLLDVPTGSPVGTKPYIALYKATSILNWDDGTRQELVSQNLNFVSLDESEFERLTDFEWELKRKYRILILGDVKENEPRGQGVYRVGVFDNNETSFNESRLITPSLGGQTLDKIPFVFINSKDIIPEPDIPPLLGLARLALTIYRGEADYRQGLFMQGQDTLVLIGTTDDDQEVRTGANASIKLPIGGEARFIGVDSTGLSEMRKALENDKKTASEKSGQLIDTTSREKESGDALRIRVSARTATLNQIALAGAFGLQAILRNAGEWLGLGEAVIKEITVTPNLDFADDELQSKTLLEWMAAKSMGAPISLRTIHDRMREKDLTTMEFEEEIDEIESEVDLDLRGSSHEDGPEPDEEDE